MAELTSSDVVVVGGGAAGLSAAVALARLRRRVVVVDAGRPRNLAADGVHNFLTRDGVAPLEVQRLGRAEVERYGGRVLCGQATGARRTGDGFEVDLEGGQVLAARRLVVATGLVDELPAVPGLREQWGRGVVHCPFCHGWEVRDGVIGVLGTSAMGEHQALLFRQLSDRVVYIGHGAPPLAAEAREQLDAVGVRVVQGPVERLVVEGDRLTGARLGDGSVLPLDALAVASRIVARSAVLDALGLRAEPHPMGAHVGEVYPSQPGGVTTVPGLYVAGNVTDAMAQVVTAAAAGLAVAGSVVRDLVTDDARRAVALSHRAS